MSSNIYSVTAIVFFHFAIISNAAIPDTSISMVFDNKTGESLYVSVAQGFPSVGKIAAILPAGTLPVKITVPFNQGQVFVFTTNAIETYLRKQRELQEYMKANPPLIQMPVLIPPDTAKFLSDFTKNPNTLVLATLAGQISENDGAYRLPLANFVVTKNSKGGLVFKH